MSNYSYTSKPCNEIKKTEIKNLNGTKFTYTILN